MKTIRNIFESYTVAFLFVCFFIFSLVQGPQFQPDSGSYELGSIVRIGMYPLTIALFKALFKNYAFNFLVLLQVCLTILSINLLTRFLKKQFALPFWVYCATVLFLLFPATFNGAEYFILSESLAYPLFLLTVLFFFKFVVNKRSADALTFACTLFVLCFTRQQFVFFYVVAFVFSAYILIFEKNFRSCKNLLLVSVVSLCTFFVTERTYHYIFQGHFAGTPFVGTQFLMRPLFVASSDSLRSISDSKQKMFINEAVVELTAKEIISPDASIKEIYMYEYLYNTMYHRISAPIWGKVWSKEILSKEYSNDLSAFEVQQIIDHNALLMGIHLVKNNFVSVTVHYIKDVIRGMGGYFSVMLCGIIAVFCLMTVFCRLAANHHICVFTLLSLLMHLGNSSLVCLFEPPLTRYMYATGVILAVMVLILLAKSFCFTENEKVCAE